MTIIYSSLAIDNGYLNNVIEDETTMLKILKTIKKSNVLLMFADDEKEYDKIVLSMRIIEYFVQFKYTKSYKNNFSKTSKFSSTELTNLLKSMGMYKEITVFKGSNFLLKKLSILLAEKILLLN